MPLAVEEAFRGGGVGEKLDRAVGHPELALDRAAAVAGRQQSVDGGMVGPGWTLIGRLKMAPARIRV
ncbi:hypothetical protein [Streptomyces sp. NPDC127190]|uniref:hypothetical protein n=1 Tax=unclassified Streptomyces TaxID=2593676 RepID=UPI0036400AB0